MCDRVAVIVLCFFENREESLNGWERIPRFRLIGKSAKIREDFIRKAEPTVQTRKTDKDQPEKALFAFAILFLLVASSIFEIIVCEASLLTTICKAF